MSTNLSYTTPIAEQAITVVNQINTKNKGNLSKNQIACLRTTLRDSDLCGGCQNITLTNRGGIGCQGGDPIELAKRLQDHSLMEICCPVFARLLQGQKIVATAGGEIGYSTNTTF